MWDSVEGNDPFAVPPEADNLAASRRAAVRVAAAI